MTTQTVQVAYPKTLLFSFTASERNLLKEIAGHWMKMYACHEVDRGNLVGLHFLTVWDPLVSLEKIRKQPCFKTDSIRKGGYEFDIGKQRDIPLCVFEIQMLCEMVKAAVECRLNRFLLIDKGSMADVVGRRLTWSWMNSQVTIALSHKLDLLDQVAGLFYGHSAYHSSCLEVEKLVGVEYA